MTKNLEIERKFLIDPKKLPNPLPTPKHLSQFYLSFKPQVRCRLISDILGNPQEAWLTVKGPGSITRSEYEYQIPTEDASDLSLLKQGSLVTKYRYEIKVGSFLWEVDQFLDNLAGLWVAEIELLDADEVISPTPSWLLNEISLDSRYSNTNLAKTGKLLQIK